MMNIKEELIPDIANKSILLMEGMLQSTQSHRAQQLRLLQTAIDICRQYAERQIQEFHRSLITSLNDKVQKMREQIMKDIQTRVQQQRIKMHSPSRQQSKVRQIKQYLQNNLNIQHGKDSMEYMRYRKYLKQVIDGDIPTITLQPTAFQLPIISLCTSKMMSLLSYYQQNELYEYSLQTYQSKWKHAIQQQQQIRIQLQDNKLKQQVSEERLGKQPHQVFASIQEYKQSKTIKKHRRGAKSTLVRNDSHANIERLALLALEKHKFLATIK